MSIGILCHYDDLKNIDVDRYEYIFVCCDKNISSSCVDTDNIVYIFLPKYFMKSHKSCRELNKELLKYDTSSLYISLIKSTDRVLFEAIRYIEILKDIESDYDISNLELVANDSLLLNDIQILLKYKPNFNIRYINVKTSFAKFRKYMRFFYYFYKLNKYTLLNILKKSDKNIKYKELIVTYHSKSSYKNIEYLVDDNSLVMPLLSELDKYENYEPYFKSFQHNRFILFSQYILFYKYFYNEYNYINNLDIKKSIKNILLTRVIDLTFYRALYLSVVKEYDIKTVIGMFDTTSYIDYLTEVFNKDGINSVIIAHGVNFKYKVNYISHGVNYYSFWSKMHKLQFDENVLIKNNNCSGIDGYIGFKRLKDRYNLEKKNTNRVKKSILVIGEYFSNDNYYTSAFNKITTKKLFKKLKSYHDKYQLPITIRTRLDDEYYHIAKEYEKYNFKITTPLQNDIYNDLISHDLIISIFSNALHESLLLRKKTLQVNFLEIENYRDLAEKGLVYYVTDEYSLDDFIDKYINDDLDKLDYNLHEQLYCNNSKVINPLKNDLNCI